MPTTGSPGDTGSGWSMSLRRGPDSIIKTALFWTPEGKRKRGRPKITLRRTVEAEMREQKKSWGTLQKLASDRQGWRDLVTALHAKGVTGSIFSNFQISHKLWMTRESTLLSYRAY